MKAQPRSRRRTPLPHPHHHLLHHLAFPPQELHESPSENVLLESKTSSRKLGYGRSANELGSFARLRSASKPSSGGEAAVDAGAPRLTHYRAHQKLLRRRQTLSLRNTLISPIPFRESQSIPVRVVDNVSGAPPLDETAFTKQRTSISCRWRSWRLACNDASWRRSLRIKR